jgi:ADP-ribose pyrophosphatase YjhB (NUDIX family)
MNLLQPVKVDGGWRSFPNAVPNVTTSGFAVGPDGLFPILYRGDKVRSAKNRWSLPSGLHVVGYTMAQQLCVELKEECNLDADPRSAIEICTYENIAPELAEAPTAPQWHWVIHILAVRVRSIQDFINVEPDKHPQFFFKKADDVEEMLATLPWSAGIVDCLMKHLSLTKDIIREVSQRPWREVISESPIAQSAVQTV